MPLAVVSKDGKKRLGKVFGDHVVDLSIADPGLPSDVISFLEAGGQAIERFEAVQADSAGALALDAVTFHAPLHRPEKFLAIGMNYGEHAKEAVSLGYEAPAYQLWFNKQVSCINDPFADVVMPRVSADLDYEAELAVVIGKTCRHVTAADAASVIGGYMVANDVSVRDWQRRSSTMTLGKSFDTHGPIGPWLTLAHEIGDPHALRLRMLVNGEERQNDITGHMIHNIYDQIAYLSTVMTLKPGDILSTGTPSGVGVAHEPPRFVQVGDVMRVEIEGLGHIENTVIAEPA
ncbi:fumarylacetoacetate hydrolase family protein [Sphingobium phenoxybenzoativorans]|uniref:Fumarylacetoacetate hydrolase family protein n=1 Tax=Sphingobium phenoxybenzoativorans TaxID=1592790 RepID=A0A975K745_9SPHN|nr:fumarylacetoacetate hydrolase family protein [Sphingobium phenoxybenzoativorans]QUT05717.1 fumarylacetoacetate hydrolase family protein [Sphingobium phenoxybenzoativorans]